MHKQSTDFQFGASNRMDLVRDDHLRSSALVRDEVIMEKKLSTTLTREDKKYIDSKLRKTISEANRSMVNFSAVSQRSKTLFDGVTSIWIDPITKEIVFETIGEGFKYDVRIDPANAFIVKLKAVLFDNGDKITGISDVAGPSKTVALSQSFAIHIDKRLDDLEDEVIDLQNTKADITYVDAQNATQNTTIALKADKSYVDAQNNAQNNAIALKADKTYVDNTFSTKTYVDAQNATQNTTIALKSDKT
jgi:hypothetical protein